jgi:aspartate kinase
MIVMKFGGTSVGSAAAIRRVSQIIQSRLERKPVIIVSAVAKTTDDLVSLFKAASQQDQEIIDVLITRIIQRHHELIDELQLNDDTELQAVVERAESHLRDTCAAMVESNSGSRQYSDAIVSTGEYLSSNILAAYLRSQDITSEMTDARDMLTTDSQFGKAVPDVDASLSVVRETLIPKTGDGVVPVIQGFIGSDREGRTTTLGRGGSDYSATLFGRMLDADAVEIWTDVDGVMTADPTLVTDVKRIRKMTFQEAAELAYFGARVLHPATLLPAIEQGIPVFVLNSMRPDDSGTEIIPSLAGKRRMDALVKSIAYKEGLTVITIKSTRMLMAYGFMAKIFEVFNRYKTAVDLVSTSEVSVSMTVDSVNHIEDIQREISQFAEVEVQYKKATVCVVGENIRRNKGMAADIFDQIRDVEIHLISQGASEINISFVISESDIEDVVKNLHKKFFAGELDGEIFADRGTHAR